MLASGLPAVVREKTFDEGKKPHNCTLLAYVQETVSEYRFSVPFSKPSGCLPSFKQSLLCFSRSIDASHATEVRHST